MSEENKTLARKVYEIIASGDFERANEIVDPNAPDNERPECPPEMEAHRPKLIDTFRQFATEMHTAFPDAHIEVEDMIAEGDKVTARVTMSGTHQGEFQGIAPHRKSGEGASDRHLSYCERQDRGALGARRQPRRDPARAEAP
jgi:predicted ester cyclase